jgi:hypothetical protein
MLSSFKKSYGVFKVITSRVSRSRVIEALKRGTEIRKEMERV